MDPSIIISKDNTECKDILVLEVGDTRNYWNKKDGKIIRKWNKILGVDYIFL